MLYHESKTVYKQVKVRVTSPVWIHGLPRKVGDEVECNEHDAVYMQNIGRVKIIQSGKTS